MATTEQIWCLFFQAFSQFSTNFPTFRETHSNTSKIQIASPAPHDSIRASATKSLFIFKHSTFSNFFIAIARAFFLLQIISSKAYLFLLADEMLRSREFN